MATATECALLAPDDEAGIAQMLAIYQAAIVASEQKTPSELRAMLHDARYRIVVARRAGDIIAFAILFFPAEAAFWLLEYMAVEASERSRGHGERVFLAARQIATDTAPGAPCVLEVDRPLSGAPDEEAVRRLRFYCGLGCRRIEGLDYILPLDTAGVPPPMWLLVHGLDGRDCLNAGELAQWLRTIYVDVYARPADDPRLFTMLSQGDELREMRLLSEF